MAQPAWFHRSLSPGRFLLLTCAATTGLFGLVWVWIVAAPMAFFPFSGWKDSFFGDLHAHGRDAISFYTEQKVLMSRWF